VTLNAADFSDLAVVLSSRADAVQGYGDDLARKIAAATWSGPVAERFRQTVSELQRRFVGDADRLRAAATDLRHLATALDEQLAQLRAVEFRVRAWFAANPPGLTASPPPWPPDDLPPSGDPRWLDVQRAFAAAGVA
jgi:uncharacterized protein YukE